MTLSLSSMLKLPQLFRAAITFRVTWSQRVRHRNALTEIAWEDAVQGLGMTMSTVASEKTGKCCLLATCFTNSDISACCFTSVSRARPPENRKYLSPARSHTFALETSREIKYATMSEFSIFLKSNNSGE